MASPATLTALQHITRLTQQLTPLYPPREAKNIAQWAVEHLSGKSRVQLYTHPQTTLTPAQELQLQQISARLLQHEPIQYIIGQAPFWGMLLQVNPSVLIPRPETEELVQLCLAHIEQTGITRPRIIDIGTGSGCIALALGRALPQAQVYALDISPEALQTAQQNAAKYGVNISFLQSNILATETFAQLPQKLDVIISNPPYITQPEQSTLPQNVTNYEPHIALFVPANNALLFYRAIAVYALQALKPNGVLFFEVHENYAHQVQELLSQLQFKNAGVYTDLSGRNRMVKATVPYIIE